MINKLTINPTEYDIKLVYAKGKNVEQIAKEHNADIAINFSYVDYISTGTIYGNTVVDGKKLFGDFEKVKNRVGLGVKDKLYIGQLQEGSSSYSKAGPLLVLGGKDVREQQIKLEQIQPDIAYSDTERIGIGLKGDTFTILYGKATLPELTQKAIQEGLDTFVNGDGGGSATVYVDGKVINRSGYLRPVAHAWVFVKKNKPILVIDSGHGGKDGGGGSNEHWKEKDFALKISLYQYARFKELGVNVALTRDSDIYLSPTARTDIVKNSGAKYCISNHLNAYTPLARGVETIHSIFGTDKLARSIYDGIVKEGMKERRVFSKKGANGKDYYFMHRETGAVETIIVEYGFATNKEDTDLLLKDWRKYAESVVKSFCEHIGHKYVFKAPLEPIPNIEDTNTLKEKIKALETNLNTQIKDNEQLKIENGQYKEKIAKIKTLLS